MARVVLYLFRKTINEYSHTVQSLLSGQTMEEVWDNYKFAFPQVVKVWDLVAAELISHSWAYRNRAQIENRVKELTSIGIPFPGGWYPEGYDSSKIIAPIQRDTKAKVQAPGKVLPEVFQDPLLFKHIDFMAAVRASCGHIKRIEA